MVKGVGNKRTVSFEIKQEKMNSLNQDAYSEPLLGPESSIDTDGDDDCIAASMHAAAPVCHWRRRGLHPTEWPERRLYNDHG